jgi:hypothetical protein
MSHDNNGILVASDTRRHSYQLWLDPQVINALIQTLMVAVARIRYCWRCRCCLFGLLAYTGNTVYTDCQPMANTS